MGNCRHLREERLRLAQHLIFRPLPVLCILGFGMKANLLHETFARFTINNEFVIDAAVIQFLSAFSIRKKAGARFPSLADSAENSEIGQQHLDVIQQFGFTRRESNRAAQAFSGDIDGTVGLEQTAQVAFRAIFSSAPNDLGHSQFRGASKSVMLEKPREQDGTNKDMGSSRNDGGGDLVDTTLQRESSDCAVDLAGYCGCEASILAPEVDDRRFFPFPTVGKVAVARDQADQKPDLVATFLAELPFSGLNQQFIAGLEILKPDFAAGRVEIVPGGCLDLIPIQCFDAKYVR